MALIAHGRPEGTVGPCLSFSILLPVKKAGFSLYSASLFCLFCFISLLLSCFLVVDKMCPQQRFPKASVGTPAVPPSPLGWALAAAGVWTGFPAPSMTHTHAPKREEPC